MPIESDYVYQKTVKKNAHDVPLSGIGEPLAQCHSLAALDIQKAAPGIKVRDLATGCGRHSLKHQGLPWHAPRGPAGSV